ncbi:HAD hydrolase family protein [Metasolibacillus meyeri]|uniref:HAD hydrolase family protein n=1 Tax=Metasolibacillus meyeri TaxID=1071052 RepID=UPI00398A63A2
MKHGINSEKHRINLEKRGIKSKGAVEDTIPTALIFNLSKEESIAFGDSENDIDMLDLVDIGIAMGNASEKLKQVADFVTKDSDKDGIAYALKHYGFFGNLAK